MRKQNIKHYITMMLNEIGNVKNMHNSTNTEKKIKIN